MRVTGAYIVGPLLVALAWEALRMLSATESHSMPSLTSVFAEMPAILRDSEFWAATSRTLLHLGAGIGVAVLAGWPLGWVTHRYRALSTTLAFPVDFFRSVPAILLYYLFIGLIGLDPVKKMLLVGFYLALPQSVYVRDALTEVDKRFSFMALALRLPGKVYYKWVVLPSILPYALSSLRVLVSWALVLIFVFELFTANFKGIGEYVYRLYEQPNQAPLAACIFLVGFAAFAGLLTLSHTERSRSMSLQ